MAAKDNRSPEDERRDELIQVNVRLTRYQKWWLYRQANRVNIGRSELVRNIVGEYIRRAERRKQAGQYSTRRQ